MTCGGCIACTDRNAMNRKRKNCINASSSMLSERKPLSVFGSISWYDASACVCLPTTLVGKILRSVMSIWLFVFTVSFKPTDR